MSTIEKDNKQKSELGYVLGTTRRLILKVLGAEFVEHQIPLTIEQFIFLHIVRNMQDGATQQELANHTCKDKSAILRTIDILEKQGLVKRSQDAGDRRKNIISTTEACERLFSKILKIEEHVFGDLTQGISAKDYETTIRVMLQLQQNANATISAK